MKTDPHFMLKSYVGIAGIKTSALSLARLKEVARALYEVEGDTMQEIVDAVSALSRNHRRELAFRNGRKLGAGSRSAFSRSLADKYARRQADLKEIIDNAKAH